MFKLTVSSLLFMNKPTKNMTNSIMGLLLCAGLLSVPTYTWATQTDPIEQTVAFKTCRQEISNSDNRYLGSMIQHQLVSLYKTNSEFKKQFTKDSKAFTDGIIGPHTQYWLAYFCGDFSFTAPPATDHYHLRFMQALLMDLSRAYQLNTLFPTWRTKIKPEDLLQMTPQQIMQQLGLTSVQSNNNSLVKGELNNTVAKIPDSDTRPYYYQLTDKDFANLTLRQSILETFTKLEKQQFDQRTQLYNQLTDLFMQLDLPKEQVINIDTLIESHTIETKQPSATSTTSTSSSEITQLPKEESTASKGNQTVQTTTQSESQTTAPQLVWQINAVALNNTLQQFNIVALSKEELTTLSPLVNEVFPSLYLMEMAVKLSGESPSHIDNMGIFNLAKKNGRSPSHAIPMIWDTPPDCGCQDSLVSVFNVGNFYGFYPYWQHPLKEQTIDFSRLDRLGYIGAVIKPEDQGNTLELPQNWQKGSEFSQFIQITHRYRSKLDLVITTPRNLSENQLTALFSDEIIKRIVAAVTTPMDKYFINNIQPWISFGLKNVPTMADGITLDIDLSILDTQQSQEIFFSFLHNLKIALRQSYQQNKSSSELDFPAKDSDRYYVNVIVPVKDVVTPIDNFYTFNNLDTLSKWSNILIIRPSSPDTTDEAKDEITQIKELQQWLSSQSNQSEVQQIYKRMVPMLITEDNRNQTSTLTQLVNLSSWSFLGAAYWPLPLNETNQKLIQKTFFIEDPQYPQPLNQILNSINTLLNWACIYRWEIRTGLFISFSVIFLILIMSTWHFPLRKYLSRLPFVALSAISVIGLMLVFVADPVFQDYQGPILLVFMVVFGGILFVVRMVRKDGDKP